MIEHAFVLGAGLGTRLRPLTEFLPKPLIPVWGEPLMNYAFAHLHGVGVRNFIVNTHWCPEAYAAAYPDGRWRDSEIAFRHEPILLETAGGIANVADLLPQQGSFWVYNGDILSTIPLADAVTAHEASDAVVTMVLRRHGGEKVVAYDDATQRVVDIRNLLGTGAELTHQFTGLYLCRREFIDWLTPGKIESSRAIFLEIIRRTGRVQGVVIDDGLWMDLGDRASYLQAHGALLQAGFSPEKSHRERAGVTGEGVVSISPEATVEAGAVLRDSIIWPGAVVRSDAVLDGCVVRSGQIASGHAHQRDF
jgi:mannose-1-phosphate guanylyltransferase